MHKASHNTLGAMNGARRCNLRAAAGLLAFALVFPSALPAQSAPTPKHGFRERFVLFFANLTKPADRDALLGVMRRAAAVGYNGIVLGDNGGQYLHLKAEPPAFFDNFREVRKEAKALHLALIPYSFNPTQVTYIDPSLAEAVPVRGTPFVVQGDAATVADAPPLLQNPALTDRTGNQPAGWDIDAPGKTMFLDTSVTHAGDASLRIVDPSASNPPYGHARQMQKVAVTPFHAYELSVWIKTQNFTRPDTISLYVGGNNGQQTEIYSNRDEDMGDRVAQTQDWTQYTADFNSVTNSSIEVYAGVWADSGARGTLWMADMNLREIGLAGVVRRPSLPIVVTAADGKTTYGEGADYAVGDQRLTIPPGSAIRDGTRLKVSWYQGATMVQDTPPASAWQPGYWTIEADISRRLDALFGHPPAFMMTYDEWRAANWDPIGRKVSAGAYVAQTTRRSIALLRRINPKYEISVWSDMYDPNENAVDHYFIVNGSLQGSWNGLAPGTVVMTWDGGARALQFFSHLGVRQVIGGYYDSVDNVRQWLDEADQVEAQGAQGIDGFLYTTWDGDYTDLEAVAALIKSRGRWGTAPAFPAS